MTKKSVYGASREASDNTPMTKDSDRCDEEENECRRKKRAIKTTAKKAGKKTKK